MAALLPVVLHRVASVDVDVRCSVSSRTGGDRPRPSPSLAMFDVERTGSAGHRWQRSGGTRTAGGVSGGGFIGLYGRCLFKRNVLRTPCFHSLRFMS